MKLLVFGRTGQIAQELARLVPHASFLSRAEADLADPNACVMAIDRCEADAVINAAAWTAVDRAEEERTDAFAVNAAAPTAMARACAARGLPLVHISTDYVFDGSGDRPWRPGDPTGPLGVYGASKLAGEDGVREADGVHAILRTSWVFSAHGGNFVKTMLRLAETHERLTIVADQIGGPTWAGDIARTCVTIAAALREHPQKTGTYHYAGAPDVSWADFARSVFDRAGRTVEVVDIATVSYPTPAPRPLNSRLDCTATEERFGIARPDWRVALDRVLADLGAKP